MTGRFCGGRKRSCVCCAKLPSRIEIPRREFVYGIHANKGTAGEKSITVTIINEGESETRAIKTGAEFLRGALEQEGLIEGRESEYGLYVLTVNGVTADESQQQWWCFTKGGESLNTGVDATPIADGDAFEITLKTGW